jgi:hypothetical protein
MAKYKFKQDYTAKWRLNIVPSEEKEKFFKKDDTINADFFVDDLGNLIDPNNVFTTIEGKMPNFTIGGEILLSIPLEFLEEIKENNTKNAIKEIKSKVVTFIDSHQYTTLAIGTGALVGTFLLVKHFLKRK